MSIQLIIANLLTAIGKVLQPFVDALKSPLEFASFLGGFGYESLVTNIQQIEAKFSNVKKAFETLYTAIDTVSNLRNQDNPNLIEISNAVKHLGETATGLMRAIEDLKSTTNYATLPAPLNLAKFWKDFPAELVESLLHRYLEEQQPKFFGILTALGILSKKYIDQQSVLGNSRHAYYRRRVKWELLEQILTHPDKFMPNVYGLGGSFAHEELTNNIVILAAALGLPAGPTELPDDILTTYYANDVTVRQTVRQVIMSLYFDVFETGGVFGVTSLEVILAPIPPAGNLDGPPSGFVLFPVLQGHTGKGIEITPSVTATLEGGFENAGAISILVYSDRASVDTNLKTALNASARLSAERSVYDPWILIGDKDSTHIWLAKAHIALQAKGEIQDIEAIIEVAADSAAIVINLGEGDSFLNKIFGNDPQIINLATYVRWSSRNGLTFSGSPGLEINLALHQTIGGIIQLESLLISLKAGDQTGNQPRPVLIQLAVSGGVKLGPLVGTVDQVGVEAALTFPQGGGNLGPADFDLDFKPPNGAGLSIDAGAIVGGGYLFFNKEKSQYGGVLYLEVKGGIAIKAIGLITTKMPDGSSGFSLLIIITAEFSPIQLGFGFSLNGVGGLAGFNRTMKLDALREGIKNRTLDSIMFPPDPIANAPKIISDLQTVFPPAPDQFIFAPMAKLAWGKSVLVMEIGLAVELFSPLRLAIMGKLHLKLPPLEEGQEDSKALVEMHMDVLGTIDFDRSEASVDAVLYDSRIVEFPLTGGMAMRLRWGNNPVFALAIGGFNPRFTPPPGFPSVARLALQLNYDSGGLTARFLLQSYLAVTTNTLQFGARIDAYAKLSGATVTGYLGFDALIEFFPFHFIVDIYGGVTVEAYDYQFSVDLWLTLSGPSPWLGDGHVTVEFLGTHEFPIRFQMGEQKQTQALPPANPLDELAAALSELRNWSAALPAGSSMIITLRQLSPDETKDMVVAHPLGELTVRQQVLPLGLALQRFGASVPTSPGPFDIEKFQFGDSNEVQRNLDLAVRDQFARGQFVNLTEDQKLSAPAFERFRSGQRRIGTEAISYNSDSKQKATFNYDVTIIDKKNNKKRNKKKDTLPPGIDIISNDALMRAAQFGAASQSPMVSMGSAKFAANPRGIHVNQPLYVVAGKDDLQAQGAVNYNSYTEAEVALHGLGEAFQVVEAYEAV